MNEIMLTILINGLVLIFITSPVWSMAILIWAILDADRKNSGR